MGNFELFCVGSWQVYALEGLFPELDYDKLCPLGQNPAMELSWFGTRVK